MSTRLTGLARAQQSKITSEQARDLVVALLEKNGQEIMAEYMAMEGETLTSGRTRMPIGPTLQARLGWEAKWQMVLLMSEEKWKIIAKQKTPAGLWMRTIENPLCGLSTLESDGTDTAILGVYLEVSVVGPAKRGEIKKEIFWSKKYTAKEVQMALISSPVKETRIKGINLATQYRTTAPVDPSLVLNRPVVSGATVRRVIEKALDPAILPFDLKCTTNKNGRTWTAKGDNFLRAKVQSDARGENIISIEVWKGRKDKSGKMRATKILELNKAGVAKWLAGPGTIQVKKTGQARGL